MNRFRIGQLVRSRQGRDKDHLYAVIAADHRFIYIADGSKWTVERTKKKNAVHLQLINVIVECQGKMMENEDIIHAIRTFENRKEN